MPKGCFESIGIMKKKYPNDADYIQHQFDNMCKELGINFYAELRISGKILKSI